MAVRFVYRCDVFRFEATPMCLSHSVSVFQTKGIHVARCERSFQCIVVFLGCRCCCCCCRRRRRRRHCRRRHTYTHVSTSIACTLTPKLITIYRHGKTTAQPHRVRCYICMLFKQTWHHKQKNEGKKNKNKNIK